jgi:pectate lyase
VRLPRFWMKVVFFLAALVGPRAADAGPCANSGVPGTPYEGFGASTPGGSGASIYRVTTLADSGPGSLRDALAAGHRCVIFDVGGTIRLSKQIYVRGAFVTVDGFTAPAPGITVRDYGISVWGTNGAHDIILRGLRLRDAGQPTCRGVTDYAEAQCWDAIQVKNGAARVVIDHVSIHNASDGALDITGSKDVTVQWSILSGTGKQSLIGESPRVSMHHNLLIHGQTRHPQVGWKDTPPKRDLDLDFRNNVVWGFSAYGTVVRDDATANVVNNYYYSTSRPTAAQALVVSGHARAYARGNHSGTGADVDGSGTERSGFSAASVRTTDACRAAYEVLAHAGARGPGLGPDAIDRGLLAGMPSVQLPGCTPGKVASTAPAVSSPPTTPATQPAAKSDLTVTSLAMPASVERGRPFPIQFGVTNRGTGPAAASRVRIYLSTSKGQSASDVLLRSRSVSSLAPGASQSHRLTEIVPAKVKLGSYYMLLVVGPDGAASGSTASHKVIATPVKVH